MRFLKLSHSFAPVTLYLKSLSRDYFRLAWILEHAPCTLATESLLSFCASCMWHKCDGEEEDRGIRAIYLHGPESVPKQHASASKEALTPLY